MDLRNPRIAIIGHSTTAQMVLIAAVMKAKNIDTVEPSFADAEVTADWVLGLDNPSMCPTETMLPTIEPNACDDSYNDGHQHWRGGSRGKGGKIKYRRT